eukprot:sb/3470480/
MIKGFVVLLILGVALRGAADEQVDVASATARTVYWSGDEWKPDNVLDGNTGTVYHSDTSNYQEQWLKLELTEPQDVSKVIIINRLHDEIKVTNRLLGTKVSLIGATSTTTCGIINSVNSNGESVSDQTYTVSCPATTEKTNAVLLSDNVMEETHDKGLNRLVMNIAEVMIYKVTSGRFCTKSDLITDRIHVKFFPIARLYAGHE